MRPEATHVLRMGLDHRVNPAGPAPMMATVVVMMIFHMVPELEHRETSLRARLIFTTSNLVGVNGG
jgi:hypothetical protein